jgi:phosphatidylserine/phosphatidylglycerophosphate/cardiolipin synthase-like enzyme
VDRNHDEDDPVAYAVPTFQAPPAYFKRMLPSLRSDNDVIHDLLQCATSQSPNGNIAARVSTAYLNPTNRLLQALSKFNTIHFLTAGRVSHGFKPKPKAGNRGKDWIPTVFAYAAQRIAQKAKHAHVWYYHRPDWSFHAKGIWLTDNSNVATTSTSPLLPADSELYAVTHGSSNYGERSSRRDMESNLVLVLPQGSPLVQPHVTEWNDLCKYAVSSEAEGSRPVAASIKAVFPLIKWFF